MEFITRQILEFVTHQIHKKSIKQINKYEKKGRLNLHYMDLTDTSSITNLIKKFKPDEFYNLAAMSHVGISFYTGEATLNINTLASYRILLISLSSTPSDSSSIMKFLISPNTK